MMYLRQQINNMNNGIDTMQTAAIFKVVSDSEVENVPLYNTPPRSVKPRVTQFVTICQLSLFTKRGQMYEFHVPMNFNSVMETRVGAVSGTITFIK